MNPFIAEAKSLADMLRRSCVKHAGRTALVYPENKDFHTVTYKELWQETLKYAICVNALGVQRGDRLCIIGETCKEWALVDWACQCLGVVTVPIYPTLPEDQAQYIVADSGAKVVVCSDEKQSAKVRGMPGVRALTWAGLLTEKSGLTEAQLNARIDEIGKHDNATFIYTSGTTGSPKGVILTHDNFISLSASIQSGFPVDENDRFFIFLPLAHVFARYAGHALPVAIGGSTVYAGSIASIGADLLKTSPTIVLCVPRFLESMRARVLDGVEKSPTLRKKLFYWALDQGIKKYRKQPAPFHGLLDKIVGKKLRDKIGGSVRFFVSGGAALPPHVNEFYNAFHLTVLQGYGLTETTAASCINRPWDNRPHTVGPPLDVVEIKIAGDGEILQRGSSVMKGYYNLPEDTAAAIESDGWFHTGDIGEFDDGHLKITDRKKDLLVLGNGKNVAPLPIENKLKESEFINEAVLFGDGMEYCCALIVPEFDRVKTWLKAKGVEESDLAAIAARDDVRELIKGEVSNTNKTLADYEKAKKHTILGVVFSVETGELTPSLKVKRKVVKEKFAKELDSMKR
ncbi:MAG: AMP-dependent synthetase/ligase [Fimbriimonadaceae bacterium]